MATVRKIPKAEEEEKPPTIADIFGPRGLLERCLGSGYEHRRSQLEMAEIIEEAFQNKRHALVEAGTGTGKTLAYLLPAIRSGRRVVVSTATKSLQEQLFTKDVPFLQKHFAPELKVAVMKGRGNFLCRQKLYDMADQPVLKGLDEVDWFAQMRDWEKVTETGDRNELTFLPDDASMWNKLDARRDACTGQKCAEFKRCFVTAMHQRAAEADLIIVNHHLFFADLALRGDDFGSILPEYAAVIFDEAHEIEDVASDYFGREVSNYRFEELARDADLALRLAQTGGATLPRRVARLRERGRSFFETFPQREGRFPFDPKQRAAFLEQHREAYDELLAAAKALESEIAALREKPEPILQIARRAAELRNELKFLLESEEKNFVYWYERRNKGVFLAATPIDVSGILRERLFEQFDTIVLTSATLAVGGRFDFLKQRLGIFTSYSQMNDLCARVRAKVEFPLLVQGSAPRSTLLERFRMTPGAVLFATSSFWQGVDVPGEQLSCVIVDRLPFAVPSDPIVAARVRALEEDGRNAFAEYQVPEAVLALKQGFGRLIRSRSDRGVLSILDNRIQRMGYGRIFLESLPDYAVTRDIAEVQRFMASDS